MRASSLANLFLVVVCFSSSFLTRADLEDVTAAYVDRGAVSSAYVDVTGAGRIHYLEAGPREGRAVLFCHGAAFQASTWKVTGVLDRLAEQGFRAIALDFPGYGTFASGRKKLPHSDTAWFLFSFASALDCFSGGTKAVVVSASMGGSFGLPLVLRESGRYVAGYVTVAGSMASLRSGQSSPLADMPALLIYGELDNVLKSSDPERYRRLFPNSELIVFDKAPHPAYLRDAEAASYFAELVLRFALGSDYPAKSSVPSKSTQTVPPLSVAARWKQSVAQGHKLAKAVGEVPRNQIRQDDTSVLPTTTLVTQPNGIATSSNKADEPHSRPGVAIGILVASIMFLVSLAVALRRRSQGAGGPDSDMGKGNGEEAGHSRVGKALE